MLARVIAVAGLVLFCGYGVAIAQSDGPAELPSADYQGQSYVDSKGCVFLRAGYGGAATWVPRVGQDRKQICGQTPTRQAAQLSKMTDLKTAASLSTRVQKRQVRTARITPVIIGCPVSVPVARRYATTDGGSVVVCTATNGSLTGARPPIYPEGSGVGASLSATPYPGATIPLAGGKSGGVRPLASSAPPAGFETAWRDDRFNPMRGKGTVQGQAAQDKVWTRDVPAQEIASIVKPGHVRKSVSIAPVGVYYVQVGTFGEPSNADKVRARLAGLGLPISNSRFEQHGRTLQVVYAGPFSSGSEAHSALGIAHQNGFSDAFIR